MATVLDLTDDWDAIAPRDAAYPRGRYSRLLDARFPAHRSVLRRARDAGLAGMAPGPAASARSSSARRGARRPACADRQQRVGRRRRERRERARAARQRSAPLPADSRRVVPGGSARSPHFHAAGATLSRDSRRRARAQRAHRVGCHERHRHVALGLRSAGQLDPRWLANRTLSRPLPCRRERALLSHARAFGVTTRGGRFVPRALGCVRRPGLARGDVHRARSRGSIEAATAALARYPGPTHNFAFADARRTRGVCACRAIFQTIRCARAGFIRPPISKTYAGDCRSRRSRRCAGARRDRLDGQQPDVRAGYPLALSPQFAPPYRAYRIANCCARATPTTSPTSRRCRWTRSRCRSSSSRATRTGRARAAIRRWARRSRNWDGEMSARLLPPRRSSRVAVGADPAP